MIDALAVREWLGGRGESFGLAGISSDDEVFISVSDPNYFMTQDGLARERDLIQSFRASFPGTKNLTFVVKPSLQMMQQMVDDLNRYLDQSPGPAPRKNLLGVGDF